MSAATVSPLVGAATQFALDESKRKRRRFPDPALDRLAQSLTTIVDGALDENDTPYRSAMRGTEAVELFGYHDTFDEKAATVIADILHAVVKNGYDPQVVLDRAAGYYGEERAVWQG